MRGERGQAAPLALGLAMVAFAVAGLAVDGTRGWLERRSLQNAADAAVLAGAGAIDTDSYRATGGDEVKLDVEAGRAAVLSSLRRSGIRARMTLRVTPEDITLVLRHDIPATFLSLVGIERLPVAIEARSAPSIGTIAP